MTPIRRILVPTDFSQMADRALDLALEMARAFGAQLTLVHVTAPVMVLPPPLELVPIPTLFPDMPRRINDELEARTTRARQAGIASESQTLSGNPHVEIVRHAGEIKADLIVMGTHGRSGISHAVLGSVAERVVHRAPCPVLIVPDRR